MVTSEQRVVAGRYRLRRPLGQGSMGTVWEAYDEFLHRPVAVKEVRLPPGIPAAEADELRERTLREARAIAVVSHPNVITLHDVAREDGDPFVVMEYIPARSLAELIRQFGPLQTPQAATIGYAVAAGLAAAHQAGITHRDVKPGNVLVGEDGRVKLTDFGIARNMSELTMTRTGIMLGSPAYIAPEVAAGREVTPAADLWGLGATLFAAVEGRAPYDPDAPVLETLSAVVHGDVPRPESAGPLAEVIAALMDKDPERRAPLAEVRRMLQPLLPPSGTALFPTSDDEIPTREELKPAAAPAAEPEPPASEPAPPLAVDPGPLPFPAPGAPQRPARRGVLVSMLVALLALVLFGLFAAGGFALARVIGGAPVLPPARVPAPPQQTPTPLGELTVTAGDASTLAGEQGGGFSVPVPRGWAKFVEQRASKELANSTVVRFVSPDGTQQLTVERFPAFYPDHKVARYLSMLKRAAPRYDEVSTEEVGVGPRGPEKAIELVYKTTDAPGRGNRVTFARVIPAGIDLWVVAVTVPIEQEDTGRTKLFDKIAPDFAVTG
ncbi:MAG TPA: serine/threonine-protein kinase [Actinophytocola sp.]|uniref:serine/threonine-protein kinase n=1 Tax=Actinophytocola sp. TaxID=1872138 RepID=UPI002DDC99AB|nr:serine/threonine-protein kinase [Actinophytocola sp.]HEV2783109.1 serine/threonine-protein kinase [Actinophytocola sp.]